MKFLVIFALLLFSISSFAGEGRIEQLGVGETMPFDGFAVDSSQMKHFRQINEEKKILEEKTIKLEQLNVLQSANGEWYRDNYYKLKKDYEWQQTKSFWEKTLYFFGGVVLTGAISYGTIKYMK